MTAVYVGAAGRAARYIGTRTDTAIYLGVGSLFPPVEASWTPANLATLPVGWWDAADAETLTLSGTSVTAWANKGSAGGQATQANAIYQPVYSASLINGLPVVSCHNQYLETGINLSSSYDIVAMLDVDRAHWGTSYAVMEDGYTRGIKVEVSDDNGSVQYVFDTSGYDLWGDELSAPVILVVGKSSTDGHVIYNGDLFFTDGVGSEGLSSICLGDRHLGGITIYLQEVILLNYALSEADRQKLEGYLAWKWGHEAALPIGHPYKTAAPIFGVDPVDPLCGGWNTTIGDAGLMVFSNNDRTVTCPTSQTWPGIMSKASITTGKVYLSVRFDAYEYGGVGINDIDKSHELYYGWDGQIYSSDGGTIDNIGGFNAPCDIDIAIDADAHLIWFRVDGGVWNDSGSSDPTTGAEGFTLPGTGLTYYVQVGLPYFAGSQRTLNTGTVPFAYPPPAGFSPLAT